MTVALAQRLPAIAGVDEVGRGALAGPVVAAAVILAPDCRCYYRDSKKLTAMRRLSACDDLYAGDATAISIGWAMPKEIDRINILQASLLAMRRAAQTLAIMPDALLVDGNQLPCSGFLEQAVVKADDLFSCVGAASIIAKCFRDRWMINLSDSFPEYGFADHKGYGAPVHLRAIEKYGSCCWHRKSFAPLKQPSLFAP